MVNVVQQLVDLIHWLKDLLHNERLQRDNFESKSTDTSSRMDESDSKSTDARGPSGDKDVETANDSKAGSESDSIQAVEKLMQKQSLAGNKNSGASVSSEKITTGSGGGGDSACSIPFIVERVVGEEPVSRYASPKFVIRYAVPSQ